MTIYYEIPRNEPQTEQRYLKKVHKNIKKEAEKISKILDKFDKLDTLYLSPTTTSRG